MKVGRLGCQALILLGSIESLITGVLLMLAPSMALGSFLSAAAAEHMLRLMTSQPVVSAFISVMGVLIIFYGLVMLSLAVCPFNRLSIVIKGWNELGSGFAFIMLYQRYSELLSPVLLLLAGQHLVVATCYLLFTELEINGSTTKHK